MEKPWLKHYPPGVPAEVPVDTHASLAELLEESFGKYASRDAAACMDRRLRFRDVDEMSQSLGAWLQSLNLERGTRIALMMPNLPQYMVAIAAVLRAGYAVVNVNPLYTARELEHQLKDSGAEVIIVLENFAATLAEVIDRTQIRHVVLASMGDLLGFWKGQLVNFVVRHLRKMVPEYRLPLDAGQRHVEAGDAPTSRPTMSRSCNTPGGRPASPRVPRCFTETWWRTSGKPKPGSSRCSTPSATGRSSSCARCPCTTSSLSPSATCWEHDWGQ